MQRKEEKKSSQEKKSFISAFFSVGQANSVKDLNTHAFNLVAI